VVLYGDGVPVYVGRPRYLTASIVYLKRRTGEGGKCWSYVNSQSMREMRATPSGSAAGSSSLLGTQCSMNDKMRSLATRRACIVATSCFGLPCSFAFRRISLSVSVHHTVCTDGNPSPGKFPTTKSQPPTTIEHNHDDDDGDEDLAGGMQRSYGIIMGKCTIPRCDACT
jgi:hypothetical protein